MYTFGDTKKKKKLVQAASLFRIVQALYLNILKTAYNTIVFWSLLLHNSPKSLRHKRDKNMEFKQHKYDPRANKSTRT